MSVILVACTDMNGGIGDGQGLLFDLPKDLKHFNSITSGNIVVMGRKTYESIPEGKRPLKKRRNIVLTRDVSFNPEGVEIMSFEEVLELAKTREVFVIGGGDIYNQFMPHADKMILTHVHALNYNANTFFPDFNHEEWAIVPNLMKKHEIDDKHEVSFTFATYLRKNQQ
jgi:dihydrofolate reductase